MPISAKRKLVVGAASLVVLVGTGGAYAAAQSSTPTPTPTPTKPAKPADPAAEQKAFLDDVAKRLNVPREQLDAAIKGAAEARIDAAVAAGRLTKEQGEKLKERLANGGPVLGLGGPGPLGGKPGRGHGGPGGPGGPGRGGGGRGFMFGGLDGAASYLGLSEDELREQLRDGKSLADVAKARGKTVDGLKAALKSALTERLDEAVKDGKLTAEEKDKILSNLDARLDDIVNGTRPAHPRFRHP